MVYANKVVILEGPDGAGKTTLANVLKDRFGYQYHHEGPPPPEVNPLIYYGQILYDYTHGDTPVVFDRLHAGELVYGPILRGKTTLTLEGIKLMNRVRSAYAIHLVFCMPGRDVAYANWRKRKGELFTDSTKFFDVYAAYEKMIQNPLFAHSGVWDYTKLPVDIAAESLDRFVEGATRANPLPRGIIGSPNATFLFVGDVANHHMLDLPFFATVNSSKFLNDCLEEAGYNEYELAFTNAHFIDGKRRDLSMANQLFPQVIALGTGAQVALTLEDVKHIEIPHPAYWKRFQSRFTMTYVEKLEQIRKDYYDVSRR
jgi:hypothetical protein